MLELYKSINNWHKSLNRYILLLTMELASSLLLAKYVNGTMCSNVIKLSNLCTTQKSSLVRDTNHLLFQVMFHVTA